MSKKITLLTFTSKSSKLAKPDPKPSFEAFGIAGRGGAGRGGGFLACFGGNAGDGDSETTAPFGGA